MAQDRALHQDLFILFAIVGIAVGGFLIGLSVFVSTTVSTAPVIPGSEPPVVIPPAIEPPDVEPPVVEPPEVQPPINGQPVVDEPPPPVLGDHPAAEALRSTVEDFYLVMAEKDPRRLMEFYSSADTYAEWVGQASVYGGVYDGFRNVRLLWASVMGSSETIDEASFTDYSASFVGDKGTVSYTLTLVGRGKLVGDFNMEIDVVTMWEYVNGQWTIIHDSWDFVNFQVEIVAQGTVFPLHWQKRGDFSIWDERIARLFNP